MAGLRMYDIIMKKRNGGELSEEEIAFFIKGYTKGEIPDYQGFSSDDGNFLSENDGEGNPCPDTGNGKEQVDMLDLSRE